MTVLRAGLLVAASTCIHCSQPAGPGMTGCACGPHLSRPRPGGLGEVVFGVVGAGGAWT